MAAINNANVTNLRRENANLKEQLLRSQIQLQTARGKVDELEKQRRYNCCNDTTIDGDNDESSLKFARSSIPLSVHSRSRNRIHRQVIEDSEDEDTPPKADVEMTDANDLVYVSETETIREDEQVETVNSDQDSEDDASVSGTEDRDGIDSDVEMPDIDVFATPMKQRHTEQRSSQRSSARRAEMLNKRLYDDYHVIKSKFRFKMVRSYPSATQIEAWNSSELSDEMPRLFLKISEMEEKIEEMFGVAWQDDAILRGNYGSRKRFCVAHRFAQKRTQWHEADDGRYACTGCVKSGSPCFTWTGEEFWLLPLRIQDRTGSPREDRASIWIR